MCRLFGLYANRNVDVRFSFYKADESFVKQSCKNLSGWGIAWFDGKRWNIYKEPRPLFQSSRAEELIKQVYGRIVVSHVRKATHGGETMENTHPWLYRGWVFAHNGIIDEKRLLDLLKSEYRDLEGSTDSERFFHLIIQEIDKLGDPIKGIKSAVDKVKYIEFSSLNFIASDGKRLYALRYAAERENYYTLYYTERPGEPPLHKLSEETGQLIEMKFAKGGKAVIIASECMTEENWRPIENKHLVVVGEDLSLKSLDLS